MVTFNLSNANRLKAFFIINTIIKASRQRELLAREYQETRRSKDWASGSWTHISLGDIHIGSYNCYVGQKHRRQQVRVNLDSKSKEFVGYTNLEAEIKRWLARRLSYGAMVKQQQKLEKKASINR